MEAGEILRQIYSFKCEVDKVNEEIGLTIRNTRQIECEIIKCSEIERSCFMKESELAKMVSIAEFELNDLIPLAASRKTSAEQIDKELEMLKKNMDETKQRISAKREKFVELCDSFQNDIGKGNNDELTIILSEKKALESEKHDLNMKIHALQTSTREYLEEILEEIQNSSSGLEAEIQRRMSEKAELLKDIGDLKNLLCSISLSEDSSMKS
ncbi:uncharacterized protein LOC109829258 [Asparagus officinalis]|nr:uncharacterized protein LOC109829258 [Asparagus officinalis]